MILYVNVLRLPRQSTGIEFSFLSRDPKAKVPPSKRVTQSREN